MYKKKVLIISRKSPWSGLTAIESLDIYLAGIACDLPSGLLYLDDGVFQLYDIQTPDVIKQHNIQSNIRALMMFNIQDIYVCLDSLKERNLNLDKLIIKTKILNLLDLRVMIKTYETIITL